MKYGIPLLWLVIASCGPDVPPSTLKGTSQHFRLFVDNSLTLPATYSFDDALAALETNWNDSRTLLAMPEGTIDYYLLDFDNVPGACTPEAAGCFIPTAVYTYSLPDQHELNHAYNFMRKRAPVLPLLAEGVAEAVGCGAPGGAPPINKSVPWREVAEQSKGRDIYEQGMQFVRYLILTEGADAFVRYFDQAPVVAGAERFGANFEIFWGRPLDDVWAAMHVLDPTHVASTYAVCPCSLAGMPTDGSIVPRDRDHHPYYTLPDPGGATLDLVSQPNFGIGLFDCGRSSTAVGATGRVLARVGAQHYVTPTDALSASLGPFIADDCASAAVTDLPAYDGDGNFTIVVGRPDTSEVTVYLRLRVGAPGHLQSNTAALSVCGDCGFAGPDCQEQPRNTSIAIQDTFFLRVRVPAGNTVSPSTGLTFTP